MDFYRTSESFLILDNGAAEDLGIGAKHLMTLADHLDANEIVLPDTLGNAADTIDKVLAFLPYYEPDYQYMGVVQGKSVADVLRCLEFYDSDDPAVQQITTLGIPRLLNDIHKHFRVELAHWLIEHELHLKFEIHFLGAYQQWPEEITVLAEYDVLRGIDTSLPISYGLQAVHLTDGIRPDRPDYYFEVTYTNNLVDENVNTYLEWAKYDAQAPTG